MIDASLHETAGPTGLIGRTPLVRLRQLEPRAGLELYAKLESQNPGGSVKDRAALAMIQAGERSGALHRGVVLLDATSGNTGISYAMLGAERGYRVTLCVPANVTAERKRLLHAYGAELILTDPMEGSDGAIREARRRYESDPDRYFYPDQYSNPANWRAHYETTAWSGHALRGRPGDERHVHRHRTSPAGVAAVGAADLGPAGISPAWARGLEAHGLRHCPPHLRFISGGSG